MAADVGALAEPIAVTWHGVGRADFRLGQTALVVGAGPIGLGMALSLRAAGARWVGVSEVSTARRAMAEQLGADAVWDPTTSDVAAAVKRETTDGVDAAFDCSGLTETLRTALHAVRPRGTVVNLALWDEAATLNPNDLVFSEASLTGSAVYAHDFPAVLAALADGRLDPQAMVTRRVELHEVVEHGFEELLRHKDRHVKILVRP